LDSQRSSLGTGIVTVAALISIMIRAMDGSAETIPTSVWEAASYSLGSTKKQRTAYKVFFARHYRFCSSNFISIWTKTLMQLLYYFGRLYTDHVQEEI